MRALLLRLLVLAPLLWAGCDLLPDPEPAADPAGAALVTDWLEAIDQAVQRDRLTPPVAARLYGYAGVALYEGLVPGDRTRRTLAGQLNGLPSLPRPEPLLAYDWATVASAAEHTVLAAVMEQASHATQEAFRAVRAAHREARLQAGVGPAVLARSAAYGERLGAALAAWAAQDGYRATRGLAYTPPTGDGLWRPTPPSGAPALEPYWGTLRPFALPDPEACMIGPPPAYDLTAGSPYLTEVVEVYNTTQALRPEEADIARYWSDDPGQTGTPPGHWMMIARGLIATRNLSAIEAAEATALVGAGLADAFISGWRAKYRYNYLRPVTAIQAQIDAGWMPLLTTPPFPEYPSGHSVGSGAASEVLAGLLGDGPFTDRTHVGRGLPPRAFRSCREAAQEAALSRLYGGIHFRAAIERGLTQGNCIGRAALGRLQTRRAGV